MQCQGSGVEQKLHQYTSCKERCGEETGVTPVGCGEEIGVTPVGCDEETSVTPVGCGQD